MSWSDWVDDQLTAVREVGQWRVARSFDARGPAGLLSAAGGGGATSAEVVSFASNDYLGLSTHPMVQAAAHDAIDRWGTGSTASRLIVGTRPCHEELECELAEWKQGERALVFSSGYAANVGVLTALGGRDVTIFSDALNHASIIDGVRLSRSCTAIYRHRDVEQLEALLGATAGRKLVVSDAVFSMDGDAAPVDALIEVCERHDALLVLDEAHSVFGPSVRMDSSAVVVRVGTLSKTLGSLGGSVVSSGAVIDLLVNRARSFIFTTALAPADAASALAALRIVRSPEGDALVARVRASTDRVVAYHASPIVPIVLGDEAAALAAAASLYERGIFVPAIRPPTVATGSSRLRVALSAAHTDEMVTLLVEALADLGLHP